MEKCVCLTRGELVLLLAICVIASQPKLARTSIKNQNDFVKNRAGEALAVKVAGTYDWLVISRYIYDWIVINICSAVFSYVP